MQIECTVTDESLRTYPSDDQNYVGGWLNVDVKIDGKTHGSGGYIQAVDGDDGLVPVLYEESGQDQDADRLPSDAAKKAVRAVMWDHWSEIWDAYEARRPKTYESMVSQTYDHHADGTAYVRTVTITTDGGDHTSDWMTMSAADRDAHDKWVEDYHDALVDIAEAEPDVRERVEQMIARGDEQDGDTLRGYLEAAEEAVKDKAAE